MEAHSPDTHLIPVVIQNLCDVAKIQLSRGDDQQEAALATTLKAGLILATIPSNHVDSNLLARLYTYIGHCIVSFKDNPTLALQYLQEADELVRGDVASNADFMLLHSSLANAYRLVEDDELEYYHLLSVYDLSLECLDLCSDEAVHIFLNLLKYFHRRQDFVTMTKMLTNDEKQLGQHHICGTRCVILYYYRGLALAATAGDDPTVKRRSAAYFGLFLVRTWGHPKDFLKRFGVDDPQSYVKRAETALKDSTTTFTLLLMHNGELYSVRPFRGSKKAFPVSPSLYELLLLL